MPMPFCQHCHAVLVYKISSPTWKRFECAQCRSNAAHAQNKAVSLNDKEILRVFPFKSKSNPDNSYECRLYSDNTTSCNCPGWTRRTGANGLRECKHTMMVDGMKDNNGESTVSNQMKASKPGVQKVVASKAGRKFDFEV